MPKGPTPSAPDISDFFQRKRRLSYYFAWGSMLLLFVQITIVGSVLEFFGLPRPAVTEEGVSIFHRCLSQEETDGSRVLRLDPSMKMLAEPLRLVDGASAVLVEGRDVTVFYGTRVSVLTDGKNSRTLDLGQKWDVLTVLRDPGRNCVWSFGWNEGKLVARRREAGAWGAEMTVASSGLVDRLSASLDGAEGPLLAWREKDSSRIRTAIFDGEAFVPRPEFEIGEAQYWDVALAKGRILLAYHHRDDRALDSVTLRTECCPGCASPLAPGKLTFSDPVLILGRKVTGLSMLLTGDQLRFIMTRPYRIVWGAVPAATLRPDGGGAKLQIVAIDNHWRNILGSITPTALVFCSFSLVFLGFTLLRERNRAAAGAPADPHPAPVSVSARTMAYILDSILLGPVFLAAGGYLDLPMDDIGDPRFLWLLLVWGGIEFLYHVVMEYTLGWTFGKRIIGMQVTGLDGGRLSLQGAVIRNLARLIDGQVPFGVILGLAMMLKTKRCQRLGDWLGRTMVVRET